MRSVASKLQAPALERQLKHTCTAQLSYTRPAGSSCSPSSSTASCCCVHSVPAPSCSVPPAQRHAGVSTAAPRQHVIAQAGFGFGLKSKKAGAAGNKANSKDCPCGSGKLYSECCQVYHKSAAAHPETPERLVQARYSAFVKRAPKYLRTTSHPDNPALQGSSTTLEDGTVKKCSYEEDLAVTFLSVEFLGLEILGSKVAEDGSSATVDVQARFKRVVNETGKRVSQPQEQTWLERATLVKDDEGHWLVKDVTPADNTTTTAAAAAS